MRVFFFLTGPSAHLLPRPQVGAVRRRQAAGAGGAAEEQEAGGAQVSHLHPGKDIFVFLLPAIHCFIYPEVKLVGGPCTDVRAVLYGTVVGMRRGPLLSFFPMIRESGGVSNLCSGCCVLRDGYRRYRWVTFG